MSSAAYDPLAAEVHVLRDKPYEVLSTRLRVAKWLIEEVGVGNTFTVIAMKQRFPTVSQIDRRMRDLRPAGWRIPTNDEDPSLGIGQFRLDKVGGLAPPRAVSGRIRRQVFEKDGNRCVVCGIGAGEMYPEGSGVAKLTLGHWVPKEQGGDPLDPNNLRTECQRCNHAVQDQTGAVVLPGSVRARVDALPRRDKAELHAWMEIGRRSPTRTEELWYQWRQLPPQAREEIRDRLADSLGRVAAETPASYDPGAPDR